MQTADNVGSSETYKTYLFHFDHVGGPGEQLYWHAPSYKDRRLYNDVIYIGDVACIKTTHCRV